MKINTWTKSDKLLLSGACRDGAAAALRYPGPAEAIEAEAAAHPDWTLWLLGAYLRLGRECPITPARLDACAEAQPGAALAYAAQLLTPSRLDAYAEARPGTALVYAAQLLSPSRLDACAEAEPWAALEYASQLLTPARLDACAKAEPWYALAYAAALLSPAQVKRCKEAK